MPTLGQQVIKIEVKGLPELQRRLRSFGEKVEKNVMRRALYAGAVVFRDEARRRAPVRTGSLRKAIIATSSSPQPGILVAKVKIDRKKYQVTVTSTGRTKLAGSKAPGKWRVRGFVYPRNYAHLVEFGTKQHGQPKRHSTHPGTTAQPFMRPAYDTMKGRAADAVIAKARDGLDQAIKEAASS